jgi:hypothetical protein
LIKEGKSSTSKSVAKVPPTRISALSGRLSSRRCWSCSSKRFGGIGHLYKYPKFALHQYHLIGRVNDIFNFNAKDPTGHPQFTFALTTKVVWSKNVSKRR